MGKGKLVVNGIGGDIALTTGATLGGSGTVRSIAASAGAVVSPGNSIGTLHANGDVTLARGAVYDVELSSDGRSDAIRTTGAIYLSEPSVQFRLEHDPALLSARDAFSLSGKWFDILHADKGVHGQFAQVASPYLFIGPRFRYSSNAITASVGRNDTPFESVARNRNQRSVAEALEFADPAGYPYRQIVFSESVSQARDILSQFTPEIYPAVTSVLFRDGERIQNAMARHWQFFDAAGNPAPGSGRPWVELINAWSRYGGNSESQGYRNATGGFSAGSDFSTPGGLQWGLSTGYSQLSMSMAQQDDSARTDSYYLGAYAGRRIDDLGMYLGFTQSWNISNIKRNVSFSDRTENLKGKVISGTTQAFAEVNYALKSPTVIVEPYGRIAVIGVKNQRFAESDSVTGLRGEASNTTTAISTVGARAMATIDLTDQQTLRLRGGIGWQRVLNPSVPVSHFSLDAGQTSFDIRAPTIARDRLRVEAGAWWDFADRASINLSYDGLLSRDVRDHSANIGVAWRF